MDRSSCSFAIEDFERVRSDGIEELLVRHYQEIAHFKDIALEIDWAKYEAAWAAGKLRIFTARIGGRIVGYAAYVVDTNPHYKGSLQAVQDVLYLIPERRGLLIGSQLIAFADRQLREEGVQATYQHSKVAHPMDAVLKRQGYELVDSLWAKRLDRG